MLSHVFNRVSRWAFWVPPVTGIGPGPGEKWLSLEKQRLQIQLAAWDAAFNPLLHSLDSAGLLLLVHRKILQVFFDKTCDGPDEMEFDKYTLQFQEAVEHAEAYMQATLGASVENTENGLSERRSTFTVALDIVLPLFLTGARCRSPTIRRRALTMLKAYRRKEGIWDSSACANVCEKVIELEEGAALPDGTIPEHARIYEMDLHLHEEKGAQIAYKRRLRDGDIESIQADLIW